MDLRHVKKGRAGLHAVGVAPKAMPQALQAPELPQLKNEIPGAKADRCAQQKARLVFPTCENDIFYLRLRQPRGKAKDDEFTMTAGGGGGRARAKQRGTRHRGANKSPVPLLPSLQKDSADAQPDLCINSAPTDGVLDLARRMTPRTCSYNRTKRLRHQKLERTAGRPRTDHRHAALEDGRKARAFEMCEEDTAFRSYLRSTNLVPARCG
eukprot:TRINITY_DN23422_c0_g1_i1.p2 TRINITY_DN23422_c0_g1~~TRINITY_DN23422_c0_g1_i1.p2  ORF type:complete len:228 (+),score=73.18 TRINITY_DN23422_c0_g1_i1:56-685(+)